jgi:hypothetical protein
MFENYRKKFQHVSIIVWGNIAYRTQTNEKKRCELETRKNIAPVLSLLCHTRQSAHKPSASFNTRQDTPLRTLVKSHILGNTSILYFYHVLGG